MVRLKGEKIKERRTTHSRREEHKGDAPNGLVDWDPQVKQPRQAEEKEEECNPEHQGAAEERSVVLWDLWWNEWGHWVYWNLM